MTSGLEREVSKVLFEIDPMDLKSVDVPEDEYDSEAKMIVDKVSAGEELSAKLVHDVFAKMFAPMRIEDYASDITFTKIVGLLRPIFAKNIKPPTTSAS